MNNNALANVAHYCAWKCNSVHYHALVWKNFSHQNIACANSYRAALDSVMRMKKKKHVNAAQSILCLTYEPTHTSIPMHS